MQVKDVKCKIKVEDVRCKIKSVKLMQSKIVKKMQNGELKQLKCILYHF